MTVLVVVVISTRRSYYGCRNSAAHTRLLFRGAEYCDERVCVCVCVCVRDHIFGTTRPIFTKFFVHLTYGRGSDLLGGGVVIRYVLLVLRMTSYLPISPKIDRRRRPAEAQCTRSLGLGYKLCAVIPAAGQRTDAPDYFSAMAAKINWHRYRRNLRHLHSMYTYETVSLDATRSETALGVGNV